MRKGLRAVAQAPQDLKLKAPTTFVQASIEDEEETNSGMVFKRKRKAITAPTEHSHLDGHAPSCRTPSTSPTLPRDMMVVQEDEGMSSRGKGLWDLNLDAPFFLENTLLPNKEKEKIMTLEKDCLVHESIRQLGQTLAVSCLVATKLKDWRGSADQKANKIVELHKGMESLQEELQQSKLLRQEAEALCYRRFLEKYTKVALCQQPSSHVLCQLSEGYMPCIVFCMTPIWVETL